MKLNNVVVAGGGVLGSQIAFQAAYCGFNVTIWLRSKDSINRCKPKLDNLKTRYLATIEDMSSGKMWANGISDPSSFNKEECIN